MAWENIDITYSGPVAVQSLESGAVVQGWCELATVYTGKTRSLHGYVACVVVGEQSFDGASRASMQEAVQACVQNMREEQFGLLSAGASGRFRESGLSSGTGYGYVGRGQAVHLMGQGYVASGGTVADEPRENSPDERICYFAYGSNMCKQQMAARCPGAIFHGNAVLKGFGFRINRHGVATLVPAYQKEVHGALWLLNGWHERTLDVYEGVPAYYRRVFVSLQNGRQTLETLLYLATDSTPGEPREGYQENIVSSARELAMPPEYVQELEGWLLRADG